MAENRRRQHRPVVLNHNADGPRAAMADASSASGCEFDDDRRRRQGARSSRCPYGVHGGRTAIESADFGQQRHPAISRAFVRIPLPGFEPGFPP
jgi:hypothetical protein